MIKVLTTQEMRNLDHHTIHEVGIPGIVLMERAAQGCVDVILKHFDEDDEPLIYIFAGKGNNGGDGLAIARYLYEAGYDVVVFTFHDPDEYKGDSLINAKVIQQMEIPWEKISSVEDLYALEEPDVIVDALFGTGFKGKLEGEYAALVEYMNDCDSLVFAVDIPSGVNGDSPSVEGPAVVADCTITMAAPKRAHLFFPAKNYVGELYIAEIGIPMKNLYGDELKVHLVEKSDIVLPYRSPAAHKYKFGRILIIAGSVGLMGASIMAAKAASLIGGGMVRLAVPESVYPLAASHLLGEIVIPIEDNDDGIFSEASIPDIKKQIEWADVVLIGPGIGRHHNTIAFVDQIISDLEKPIVVDADALFAISQTDLLRKLKDKEFGITPHYGEFAVLTGLDVEDIKKDPVKISQEFAKEFQITLNLKNAPSLVANPDGNVFINSSGNAALAKGGSGDVLAGMIIGLLGMQVNLTDAMIMANFIHGYMADRYIEQYSQHTLTPEIQIEWLPEILKEFE